MIADMLAVAEEAESPAPGLNLVTTTSALFAVGGCWRTEHAVTLVNLVPGGVVNPGGQAVQASGAGPPAVAKAMWQDGSKVDAYHSSTYTICPTSSCVQLRCRDVAQTLDTCAYNFVRLMLLVWSMPGSLAGRMRKC